MKKKLMYNVHIMETHNNNIKKDYTTPSLTTNQIEIESCIANGSIPTNVGNNDEDIVIKDWDETELSGDIDF